METPQWWEDERVRTRIAFLVAPLAAFPMIGLWTSPGTQSQDGGIFFAIVVGITYFGTLVFGVPLYCFLRERNITAFVLAPTSGAVIGAFMMGFVWFLGGMFVFPTPAEFLAFGGACGAVVGTLIWVIARPDRRTISSIGGAP